MSQVVATAETSRPSPGGAGARRARRLRRHAPAAAARAVQRLPRRVRRAGRRHPGALAVRRDVQAGARPADVGHPAGPGRSWSRPTPTPRWSPPGRCIPADAGVTTVRVRTTWNGAGGVGGFFERTFAPEGPAPRLRRDPRPARRASSPPADRAARSPIRRDHGPVTAAPTAEPRSAAVDALADLVADGDVVVLSGAGLSTDSGIPDYRGATGSLRRHTPMTYQTFTRDPRGRHRYWARSYVGWRQIRGGPAQRRAPGGRRRCRRPGCSAAVITQNVDGLHQAGGAPRRRRAARRPGPDGLPGLRGRRRPRRSSTSGCGRPTRRSARGSTR